MTISKANILPKSTDQDFVVQSDVRSSVSTQTATPHNPQQDAYHTASSSWSDKWIMGNTSIFESITGGAKPWMNTWYGMLATGAASVAEAPLKVVAGFASLGGCGPEKNPVDNSPTTQPVDEDKDNYYVCPEGLTTQEADDCLKNLYELYMVFDCDDEDPDTNPYAEEVCDGVDNDCNSLVDDAAVDAAYWYADADADGFGDPAFELQECEQPVGYVDNADDCDDGDAISYPGAEEICADGIDQDCDGVDYTSCDVTDFDGDGYTVDDGDCDDENAFINPDALEICDGLDNNCDELVDEDAVDVGTWYLDGDADGYGDSAAWITECEMPFGYVDNADDCDDTTPNVNPGATETCDGVDQDCDGVADDGLATFTSYLDADLDGFGDSGSWIVDCEIPSGYITDATDCDDADAGINPAATEICADGIDQDCSGADFTACNTPDADGDGVLSIADGGTDCNDTNPSIYPGAADYCDGVDRDCDGIVDEADSVDAGTWYQDLDGDTFGNLSIQSTQCAMPAGYVADATDCDDADASVNPAAAEICDGADQDCDGVADDGLASYTLYADLDADSYGDLTNYMTSCYSSYASHVTDATDCDDADASIYPGATEVCDGLDNDCNSTVDDDYAADVLPWYLDADGDGYGNSGSWIVDCEVPVGYVDDATDCNDGDVTVNPGAAEICDGADQDCDGVADDGLASYTLYADLDADSYGDLTNYMTSCYSSYASYVTDATDCDDADAFIYPGATEVCDYTDNDCDGIEDEGLQAWYYTDADGDAYGDPAMGAALCPADATGMVTDNTDCDDAEALANPGETEVCNDGIDNDCSGDAPECELGDMSLADADRITSGSSANGLLGWSVAVLDDLNGDGYNDYALGRPEISAGTQGDVIIRYSDADGYVASTTLTGLNAGDVYGYALANAGDQTGDGIADFMVSAPGVGSSPSNYGAAYLVNGATLATVATVQGNVGDCTDYCSVGIDVENAGDVNNDGYDDLLVGGSGYDYVNPLETRGAAVLLLGPVSGTIDFNTVSADALIQGDTTFDGVGRGLTGGDVNGDGYSDIMVGAPGYNSDAGKAALFYGPVTGSLALADADAVFEGEIAGDNLGAFNTIAGDFNADGYNDVVVCAPWQNSYFTEGGACYVRFGPVSGTVDLSWDYDIKLYGEEEGATAGHSVSVQDLDNDGNDDLLIGASGEAVTDPYSTYIGGVFVFLNVASLTGEISLADANFKLEGEYQDDEAGTSVSAGDVTGDTYPDIIVGAPYSDRSSTNGGAAYLVFGQGQ